jgi:OFA family oxalate/formate antiporter-like MFS transporter
MNRRLLCFGLLLVLAVFCLENVSSLSGNPSKSVAYMKRTVKLRKILNTTSENNLKSLLIAKQPTRRETFNGVLSVIGGAMAHLTFGTMYCWGSFLSYCPSHLKFFDGKIHVNQPPDALYVMPFAIIAQAFAMPFGPYLTKTIGASRTLLLGSWLMALATYISSYQKSLKRFLLSYSILFGAGVGLGYTAPMAAGWKWLPNQKGLISGGIQAGFGAGGFLFSLIGRMIANPAGLNPIDGSFPLSVYDHFPVMLRRLAIIYAIVSFVGSLLVREPIDSSEVASNQATTSQSGLSVSDAFKTPQLWLLLLMIICSGTAGLTTAAIYKQFAQTSAALAGDAYQTLVGGIGALFNGSGRIIWGILADRFGFRNCFTVLTVLQSILVFSYPFSVDSKVLLLFSSFLLCL